MEVQCAAGQATRFRYRQEEPKVGQFVSHACLHLSTWIRARFRNSNVVFVSFDCTTPMLTIYCNAEAIAKMELI